ncbi:MAG: fibronectin type III domain-containing protein, partial [Candidatus Thiodiazotropha sp. (ex Lucinoma kastoroae)]|nr:fibronectin type III domain-containing protein [Candidatus Thiodiazotropha sp. (ex Lucinoma kastoroae)]
SQYSDVVIADTPIAYWKLDQTTGDVAIDSVAGNNATLVGGPARNNPSGVPFDDGHSVLLNDGSTPHHIELPNTGLLDMQVFSYESWVKELPSSNCPPLYINLPLGAYSDARGIIIRLPFSTGCDSSTLEWGAGYGETERFYGGTNIDADEWHHVVVTFAYMIGTPDTFRAIRIYVDGVMVAERLNLGAGISYENLTSGTPDDMVRIGVGADGFGGEINSYFSGYMDEIAFYDYVLTPEQVEEHYYAGTQPPPSVVSIEHLVFNSGLADTILISFNTDIKIDSFTVDDFVMSGPDGSIIPTNVESNDGSTSQFLVSIPPQITPGSYSVVIGPNILGKNGLAMDQNQDGIFGEPEEDSYSSSLTLGNPDPTRVLSVIPTGLGNTPVASLAIQFELDVDPNSFAVDDIVLTGPDGVIMPSAITTTNNLNFNVSFASPLSSDGLYNLSIGPNIATLFGGGMDQDQNGTPGETPGDIYTASFELDLTPPAPPSGLNYLLAPQINIVSLSPVTVQGSRTEEVSIRINGVESVALGTGAWSLPLNLVEGTNDFILEAEDQAGNRSDPVTLRFAYDTIAPAITGYTPPNDSYTNQPSVTITVNYNETGTGIDQNNSVLTVTRDGSPVAGSWAEEINTLRFIPDQPLLDGWYQVTNQLQDLAGHLSNTVNHGFTLDTLAPNAPVINSLPTVTGNAQITVSGSKEVDSEVLLDGQILVSRNGLSDWSTAASLANGLNTLSFTVRDRAGNTSAPTVVEIYYDDTEPGPVPLSVAIPGDGISLLLDWNSYDEAANGNDIASYAVYVETTPFTSVTALIPSATQTAGNKQYTAQGLVRNQSYYLAVVAIDSQNNRLDNVTPVTATTADNRPPGEVTSLSIVPTATSLQMSWNAPTDTDGDLAGYRLFFNNDSGTQLDVATTTAERTGLSAATGYPIRITTLD